MKHIPYQLCPKCNGDGEVFVNQYLGSPTSIASGLQTCRICNGKGIIPMYPLPEYTISIDNDKGVDFMGSEAQVKHFEKWVQQVKIYCDCENPKDLDITQDEKGVYWHMVCGLPIEPPKENPNKISYCKCKAIKEVHITQGEDGRAYHTQCGLLYEPGKGKTEVHDDFTIISRTVTDGRITEQKEYCTCSNVETTDIRSNEQGDYIHVLCKKPIS